MTPLPLHPGAVVPQLPSSTLRFHSGDLDEVREFIGRFDPGHARVLLGRDKLDYDISCFLGDGLDLGWVNTAGRQRLRGASDVPLLHIPLGGRHAYRIGHRTIDTHPGCAVLIAGEREYLLHSNPGTVIAIRIRSPHLRGILERCAGAGMTERRWTCREIPLPCNIVGGLLSIRDALPGPGAGPAASVRLRELEADWVGSMAAKAFGEAHAAQSGLRGTSRIRNVEEWIDAHLDAPITLDRLCTVSGVGKRWLEQSFRARRNVTPLGFVRERRLAAAHQRLIEGHADDTVTRVALDLGFDHMGRFSDFYRRTYGECPSETLRTAIDPGRWAAGGWRTSRGGVASLHAN